MATVTATATTPRLRLATRLEKQAESRQAEAKYLVCAAEFMRTRDYRDFKELDKAYTRLASVDPRRAGTMRARELSPYILCARALQAMRDEDAYEGDPEYSSLDVRWTED